MSRDAVQRDELIDEVVRYGLLVAAEEAAIAVVRAAHSQFIVEGSDAGIGILDRHGQLIAQAAATSILHSGGIVAQLAAVLEDIPIGDMGPGDVFCTNDPYRGGVHANDVMVCRPVFVAGEVRFFTASLIHVLDLGGAAHGGINAQARETYEEGLQIPPMRWAREGMRNEDLVRLLMVNSRAPDETVGDIEALVAGTLVAAQRIEALIDEHGLAVIDDIVERYLATTETRVRREISRIPDGVYHGHAVIDDDGGLHPGRSYDIEVSVSVQDDTVVLDFAGTSPQVRAPINSSSSQAFDAAMFGVRCFLDADIPTNSGAFRPIVTRFPPGSLLDPSPPHPCGGRMMAVYAIVDAILEALSTAVPDRLIARSGILQSFAIAGVGSSYWLHNAYDFGGVGARQGHDGVDATGMHFGVGRNQIPQIEPVERRCKLRVESVERVVDSGGAGAWRGGLGSRTVFLLEDDCLISVRTDRFHSPPEGVLGGHTARPGAFVRVRPDGSRQPIESKATNVPLTAGDRFVVETSGGGGVGDPRTRAVDAVARDVSIGAVSVEAAAAVYGVMLDRWGRVDAPATDARRAAGG
jgi:N-methylhydantoinase B